ncbi:hypothetical protein CVT25_013621 [Psilocybe cyanescens]|uniref:Uncharacterized protein n=1 Tax=Psilocybe cyanescens TaxID=93625 RepID=A0A409WTC2_PSICY|nr:hypothetical protein CVT25_013621 [Psilocybe cyanescens]
MDGFEIVIPAIPRIAAILSPLGIERDLVDDDSMPRAVRIHENWIVVWNFECVAQAGDNTTLVFPQN